MTGSPMRYSPSTGGFYHVAMHGALPADAVTITSKRHRELLAGQAEGRRIFAGSDGEPMLSPVVKPRKADVLAAVIAGIKAEAGARILSIANLERQANDNAALALYALDAAAHGHANITATEEQADAVVRRRAIDAVRAASNALESKVSAWSAAALSSFDAGADQHWPARGNNE